MRYVWIIGKWEYLTRLKSKSFLLFTLLTPLIIVGVSFLPALLIDRDEITGMTLAFVAADWEWPAKIKADLDKRFVDEDGRPLYQVVPLGGHSVESQLDAATELLATETIDAYVILPDGFPVNNMVSYTSQGRGLLFERANLERAVRRVWREAQMMRFGINMEIQTVLNEGIQWTTYSISEDGVRESDEMISFLTPLAYVMILFFTIFFSAQTLMRSIITERGSRVVEILLSSVNSKDLMTGKIIGLGLIGLSQMVIYLAVLIFVGRRGLIANVGGESILYFALYGIPGYFMFAALYSAIGSVFENEQDAQQAMGLFNLIPVLPLMFSSLIIFRPEAVLVKVASYIPLFTPFLMIMRTQASHVPGWEVVATTAVLILGAWALMRGAGVIFRTAILMYGKRVTFPEIVRWLRHGAG